MKFNLETIPNGLLGSPLHIYCELQKVMHHPDTSFQELEAIIRIDSSLTARLLRVVNSAYYGFKSKVETITHALSIVGTDQLMELVVATSILGKFRGIPNELFNMNLFWRHSVAVGLAARTIAEIKKEEKPESYYVAGLLHDLGRLVMCLSTPDQALKIFEEHSQGDRPMTHYEEKHLECNHAQIGAALFERWNLPDFHQAVVKGHHDPFRDKEWELQASIVHFADYLAYEMGLGGSGEMHPPEINPKAKKLLKLDEKALKKVWEQMNNKLEDTLAAFV